MNQASARHTPLPQVVISKKHLALLWPETLVCTLPPPPSTTTTTTTTTLTPYQPPNMVL